MPSSPRPTGRPRKGASSERRQRRAAPVNLWPRRIVTGTGLVVVVALVMWGLWALVNLGVQAWQDHSNADFEPSGAGTHLTKDGWVGANGVTTVPECTPQDLHVKTVGAPSVNVGAGQDLTVTLENVGKSACHLLFGAYSLQITSGQDTYFDSRACQDRDQSATPLLLRPGSAWTGTMRWDGRRHDGCTPVDADGADGQDVAGPGTYSALVHVGETQVAGDPVVFDIK
ncbi:hypothetical protein I6B53_01685 [Schaalia sp. 19OD2882]|uniref:hypothetical protein n=1 Tax=Schaalia sp. 19OD2882 TaxID=2794089 RepID=UPI001C1EAB14|nr:hypothetical protein [Schaalia sp. 19OD2882]QWW19863.1 hypothetical protein I6B53_01685 [Schaalia sp. 19OD2882]